MRQEYCAGKSCVAIADHFFDADYVHDAEGANGERGGAPDAQFDSCW